MTTRPFPFRAASRWTALTAAAVAFLFAASLQAADKNPEYKSLAGARSADFQNWLDDARKKGYEPVYINGYDVGDHAEFAGVAIKDPDLKPFESRFDMTDDDYQDFFKEMSKKEGFHPTFVSGYHTRRGPRFAAVWVENRNKLAWQARHNQSQKEYEQTAAALRDEGYSPTCVTAYQAPDGGVRYTSLFYQPRPGVKWENRLDLTGDQLADQVDKWNDKDFRIISLHAYDTPNGLRFLALARKADNDLLIRKERHGLSGEEYQNAFNEMADKGFRPACICGYRDGGELRFAAVWTKTK